MTECHCIYCEYGDEMAQADIADQSAKSYDVSEIVPAECNCPERTCQPENNVGKVCWRSGFDIRASDFPSAVQTEPRAQSATDIQLHGCRQHGRRDCKTC